MTTINSRRISLEVKPRKLAESRRVVVSEGLGVAEGLEPVFMNSHAIDATRDGSKPRLMETTRIDGVKAPPRHRRDVWRDFCTASNRGFDATMRSAIVGPVDCVVPLSLASRADWRLDTTAK